MKSILQQCCDDAWDVIQGRKRIAGNKIIDVKQVEEFSEESKQSDYGWLSPNGTFYPVEFGNHQAWAASYLLSLYRSGKISYEQSNLRNKGNAGDSLVEMGWVLIHNPSRFSVKITRDETKRITQSQREFLYSYLCEHGENEKAERL